MGKNNNSSNIDYSNVPETLENHIFYGLQLDDEQKHFRDCIWDPKNIITICNAKAGVGKSTIALATANLLCLYGRYDGIVYICAPTMEQKQGYLPGTPDDKNAPYIEPLLQAMLTLGINPQTALISDNNIQAQKNGTAYIEFMAHTYLRGCNFEHKVIIIDESQNFTYSELRKVLTRIHDSAKVLLIGQQEQCDLDRPNRSGFPIYKKAFEKIQDDPRVAICELKTNHRGWLSTFCDNVKFE